MITAIPKNQGQIKLATDIQHRDMLTLKTAQDLDFRTHVV